MICLGRLIISPSNSFLGSTANGFLFYDLNPTQCVIKSGMNVNVPSRMTTVIWLEAATNVQPSYNAIFRLHEIAVLISSRNHAHAVGCGQAGDQQAPGEQDQAPTLKP